MAQQHAVTTESLPGREDIRAELTRTHAAFHELLNQLSDDDLRLPSGNPAWSIGGVLTHIMLSLELLPREVAAAKRGKGMYNFPPILRDRLNAMATRLAARGQTRQTLQERYDAAYAAALRALDDVRDDELDRGACFWSEGFRDIRGLYAGQSHHLAEHVPDIIAAVPETAATLRHS